MFSADPPVSASGQETGQQSGKKATDETILRNPRNDPETDPG
jgi:hypothetical protein